MVWFGEMLPYNALKHAEDCAKNSELFFTIGTSAEVYPAALLPLMAKSAGAYVVEINTKPTAISYDVDEVLEGKSGEILNGLIKHLKELRK